LYLLARGRRAAIAARGVALPELAHELCDGVGEARRSPAPSGASLGAAQRRIHKQRECPGRVGSRRRSAAMAQRAEGEHLLEARSQHSRPDKEIISLATAARSVTKVKPHNPGCNRIHGRVIEMQRFIFRSHYGFYISRTTDSGHCRVGAKA